MTREIKRKIGIRRYVTYPVKNFLGLLSHMEHMRMDPKHQFAAQYVLSRAAAERRERESLLAAAAAVNAGGFGLGGTEQRI